MEMGILIVGFSDVGCGLRNLLTCTADQEFVDFFLGSDK